LLRCSKQDSELLELVALLQQARSEAGEAPELAALQQQASSEAREAPEKLRSLLCCSSKQARELLELVTLQQARSRASGACCVAASKLWSSGEAPELAALQQASFGAPEKLQSLLRCSSKQVPELAVLQQASPGA